MRKVIFTLLLALFISTANSYAKDPIKNDQIKTPKTTQYQIISKRSKLKNLSIEEFDIETYLDNAESSIKDAWDPPLLNKSRRYKALFLINKDGSLARIKTKKGSGNRRLNKSCKKAIRDAAPFGELPEKIKILFTFNYTVVPSFL